MGRKRKWSDCEMFYLIYCVNNIPIGGYEYAAKELKRSESSCKSKFRYIKKQYGKFASDGEFAFIPVGYRVNISFKDFERFRKEARLESGKDKKYHVSRGVAEIISKGAKIMKKDNYEMAKELDTVKYKERYEMLQGRLATEESKVMVLEGAIKRHGETIERLKDEKRNFSPMLHINDVIELIKVIKQ